MEKPYFKKNTRKVVRIAFWTGLFGWAGYMIFDSTLAAFIGVAIGAIISIAVDEKFYIDNGAK